MRIDVELLFGGLMVLCFEGQINCPTTPNFLDIHQNVAYVLDARVDATKGKEVCEDKMYLTHVPEIVFLAKKDDHGNCPSNCKPCDRSSSWPCPQTTKGYCRCTISTTATDICLLTPGAKPNWTFLSGRGDSGVMQSPPESRASTTADDASHYWLASATRMDARATYLQRNRLTDPEYVAFRFHFSGGRISSHNVWRERDSFKDGSSKYVVWHEGRSDKSPLLPRALANQVLAGLADATSVSLVDCHDTENEIARPQAFNGTIRLGIFNYVPASLCEDPINPHCDSTNVNHFRWYYRLSWPSDSCPDDVVVPLYPESSNDYSLDKRPTVFCPPAGG